ncbi:hypothetical protein [Guyparkeria halopsychrophila]|uniref:hypothetical protein n=1 Tax=Guyparkeria halopsychrophila TaxID=3139421 RepID=UPI0037C6474C
METEISDLHEKAFVNNLVSRSMEASSRNMDLFSGWLLVGFAAVVGALLPNLGEVAKHVSSYALQFLFFAFFVVAILAVFAKILAVFVAGACAGSAIGRIEGRSAAENGVPLEFSVVFLEMGRVFPWPSRWFVNRSLEKVRCGEITASTRSVAKLMQIQALFTLLQALTAICVVGVLALGVTF